MRHWSKVVILPMDIQLYQHNLLERISSLYNCLCNYFKNHLTMCVNLLLDFLFGFTDRLIFTSLISKIGSKKPDGNNGAPGGEGSSVAYPFWL